MRGKKRDSKGGTPRKDVKEGTHTNDTKEETSATVAAKPVAVSVLGSEALPPASEAVPAATEVPAESVPPPEATLDARATASLPVGIAEKAGSAEEDPYDTGPEEPVQSNLAPPELPTTGEQPSAAVGTPQESPAVPVQAPESALPTPKVGVATRRRTQNLASPLPGTGAATNGVAGLASPTPTPPLKRVKREALVAQAAAKEVLALEQEKKKEEEAVVKQAGRSARTRRVAGIAADGGEGQGNEIIPASISADGSFDVKIQEALLGLSDKHVDLVRDMEDETHAVVEQAGEEAVRAKESVARLNQAQMAVKRAEEAVRIARNAQKKLEEAARGAEERAKESQYAAEEAEERLKEIQAQQQREREATLGRLVVQKNSVTMAYKELQESATQVVAADVTDTMENEEAVAAMERHVKRLNTCWLRFTMERRKFEEAVAAMKGRGT